MLRGECYYGNLGQGCGSEQSGIRLLCIVQNDKGNEFSPTTIICPFTTKQNKNLLPTHIKISQGLPRPSLILCEQIRVVDKKRIFTNNMVYKLNENEINKLDEALAISVGLFQKKD